MGKSTISMAIFKFAMWLFTRPGSLWSNFGVQKVSEDSFCHRPIILSMLVFLLSPGIVLVDGYPCVWCWNPEVFGLMPKTKTYILTVRSPTLDILPKRKRWICLHKKYLSTYPTRDFLNFADNIFMLVIQFSWFTHQTKWKQNGNKNMRIKTRYQNRRK